MRSPFAFVIAAALLLPAGALAQETQYAAGDRAEVDVNMSSNPEYQNWQTGTVTKVEMWQGQVSGIFVVTDEGAEVVSAARYMRPSDALLPEMAGGGYAVEAPGGGSQSAMESYATPAAPATRVNAAGNAGSGAGAGNGDAAANGGGAAATARPASEAGGGALGTGTYTCWAANGTAGMFRLVIRGGGQYSNTQGASGRYDYDAASGAITFPSGPWEGYYGTRLGPRKIGLSSRPGSNPNTLCDLQ